ncbi:MAG TPA: MauE/DoxX family redox-associated membrane protein [Streptosporangiaceae bacterium]
MLNELGDIQIPVLAIMLLGGCSAKAAKSIRRRSVSAGLGPTALFPLRLRPWAAGTLCAIELTMGIGLILTAGQFGHGASDKLIRIGTCLLFVVATCALIELRSIRPDIGCGCFGEFSSAPITGRTLTRSILLAAAAAGTIGLPAMMPGQIAAHAGSLLLLLLAELVLFGLLSPEVRDVLVRIGYSAPCELRLTSPEHTIAALERSKQFRRHVALLARRQPLDVWRELCWRYVAYPSRHNGREAELVFAVYLQHRRPTVLSVLVDATTGAVIPWPASSLRPAGLRLPLPRRRGSHAAPQPERPDLAGWLGDRRGQPGLPHPAYAMGQELPDPRQDWYEDF